MNELTSLIAKLEILRKLLQTICPDILHHEKRSEVTLRDADHLYPITDKTPKSTGDKFPLPHVASQENSLRQQTSIAKIPLPISRNQWNCNRQCMIASVSRPFSFPINDRFSFTLYPADQIPGMEYPVITFLSWMTKSCQQIPAMGILFITPVSKYALSSSSLFIT